jgi:putative SOS response-associated peptidase YedK
MCGRFTLRAPPTDLAEYFDLAEVPDLVPRYNVAPTQLVGAVRVVSGARHWAFLRWGLIPFWAKDPKIGNTLLNARGETIATKPAFRAAFKSRRCLIAADGFYEWQRQGKVKQPFHFHLRSNGPLAFAGLWEEWETPEGMRLESCTIATTSASAVVAPVHERMPVILPRETFGAWLNPASTVEELQALLAPYPGDDLQATPVGQTVNSAKNEVPACLEPAENQKTLFPEP